MMKLSGKARGCSARRPSASRARSPSMATPGFFFPQNSVHSHGLVLKSLQHSAVRKHSFDYMYHLPNPHSGPQTLDGPFSSVSTPIFASKYVFFRVFRAGPLQDLWTLYRSKRENFRIFRHFFEKCLHNFSISIKICALFW